MSSLDVELIKLYEKDRLPVEDICEKLSLTRSQVKNKIYKLKLKRKRVDKFNKKLSKNILDLHEQNKTNREIGRILSINHKTVSQYLSLKGLHSVWDKTDEIDMVDENSARCFTCKKILLLNEFQHGRRGQNYNYRYKQCRICRKKQAYKNMSSTIDKYLKHRYARLKNHCKRKHIVFNITLDEFRTQYEKQKGKCFYTDQEMRTIFGEGYNRNTLSVDKIIPENGYTKNNFVFCTVKVNTSKLDFELKEIKKWMPFWYERIKIHLEESKQNNEH